MKEQETTAKPSGERGKNGEMAGDAYVTPAAQNVPVSFRRTRVRPVRVDGEGALVSLTKGLTAVIDAQDAPLVAGFNWYAHCVGNLVYAARRERGTRKIVYMHRAIMGTADDIDHRDDDGLNNRRANLRPCTHQQNMANRRRHGNNRSGHKGVWERNGSFRASIRVDGKTRHLGPFPTAEEAAAAYQGAARRLNGEFAR